jgi:hypothetical protein
VTAPAVYDAPRAWNDRMLLEYPHGATARFDPRGRFVRAGDVVNGYVVDHLRVDEGDVVAVLRARNS